MNYDIYEFAGLILKDGTVPAERELCRKGLNMLRAQVLIRDAEGAVVFANREHQRLFGSLDQQNNSDMEQQRNPDDKLQRNPDDELQRNPEATYVDREYCMSDTVIREIVDESGRLLGKVEVTEVPESDEARMEYFERLAHTGIYIIDPETFIVLYENPTAQKYTVVNRIGEKCYIVHGNNSMCSSCPLRNPQHISYVNRSDHNMVFSVESSDIMWRGKPAYIISVRKQRDLSDINEQEKVMQRLMRAMQKTFGVYTEINMKTGNYRQMNVGGLPYFNVGGEGEYRAAFEHMCKYEIHPDDVPEVREKLSWESLEMLMAEADGIRELRVRYRLKNAHPHILMESSAIFIRDELPHYVVVLAKDVTEETENLKNALEAAKSASNAKTSFLENMSHDLRTPMNAIVGMTELSKSHYDDPKVMEANMDVIRDSSKHLMHIIDDVLDMAKIESGAMYFEEEPYQLLDAVHEIIHTYTKYAEKHQRHLQMELGPIQSPYVYGDKEKLARVLGNLIENAVKFTKKDGHVMVTMKELQSWHNSVMNLHFTVSDDGQGIDEEQIKSIFEPFFRGEAAKIAQSEGTGLGLSIARNIVESRGGRIFAENRPEGGAVFSFDMPFKLDMNKKGFTEETEDVFGESALDTLGMHVLLVEDNEINILVMKKILHAWGIIVEVARNGEEGCELFEHSIDGMYSFILMDIRMPIMDGYEATRCIRESDHPQAKEIPIIALTANAFTEDISKSMSAGMDYHLSKPIDVNELKKVIRSVTQKLY